MVLSLWGIVLVIEHDWEKSTLSFVRIQSHTEGEAVSDMSFYNAPWIIPIKSHWSEHLFSGTRERTRERDTWVKAFNDLISLQVINFKYFVKDSSLNI